jgi:hypothetical protein
LKTKYYLIVFSFLFLSFNDHKKRINENILGLWQYKNFYCLNIKKKSNSNINSYNGCKIKVKDSIVTFIIPYSKLLGITTGRLLNKHKIIKLTKDTLTIVYLPIKNRFSIYELRYYGDTMTFHRCKESDCTFE